MPREEYPRPDFVRESWSCLNGLWEFAFDDEDRGLSQEWFAPGARSAYDRNILVPFSYQCRASGIGDPRPHPVVWYRRVFDVPASWTNNRILLHFGAVDYACDVWVNGKHAGSNIGGYVPFSLDITTLVCSGPNELVVRVEDREFTWLPRGKQSAKRDSWACWYTRTTGIWQSVWIEPVHAAHLAELRVVPDIDNGHVDIEYWVSDWDAGLTLTATVYYRGVELTRTVMPVEGESSSFADEPLPWGHARIKLPELHLWTPETPELYDLVLQLSRGTQVLDSARTYFGMRKVHLENGRFMLNNRPYYLRMVLDQGFWPETVYTPPSVEAIRYDIEMTKAMGFNGARKHQKIEDPCYYYYADRIGLVVWAEMPSAYDFRESSLPSLYGEWGRAVLRLRNHPSIVAWVPMNESWGVSQLARQPSRAALQQTHHLVALYHFTKALDATRPVVSNDGWEHAQTDIVTIHEYTERGNDLAERYQKYRQNRTSAPFTHQRLTHLPGYAYNGEPVMITEFGGVKLESEQTPNEGWGYGNPARSPEEFVRRLQDLVSSIRSLEDVSGYCYTQLTDVEQETNGLLTFDRKAKVPTQHLAAIFGR